MYPMAETTSTENGPHYVDITNETNETSGEEGCQFGEDLNQFHTIISLLFLSTSIVTCVIAFYMYFLVRNIPEIMRDSKRHWIHWNLMMSFILRDVLTLTITVVFHVHTKQGRNLTAAQAKMIIISVSYTLSTNCFWMFVEGFYLLLGLIIHMRLRQLSWMKLRLGFIGWGIPGILVTIWATQQQLTHGSFSVEELAGRLIVVVPMYLVLSANVVIIIRVLYTLHHMIRLDFDQKQKDIMRKLAKRTLFLSILLGTYFLIPPIIHAVVDDVIKVSCQITAIIVFINSIVSSLYGFLVAILYVLLNDEVMGNAVRHLPTCLQGPITRLRLRSQSASSTESSARTKVSIINNNTYNRSANTTPRPSDADQREISCEPNLSGTHLKPPDTNPSHYPKLMEDVNSSDASYVETTFRLNQSTEPNLIPGNAV